MLGCHYQVSLFLIKSKLAKSRYVVLEHHWLVSTFKLSFHFLRYRVYHDVYMPYLIFLTLTDYLYKS